jgi:hypothetical protein
MRLSSERHQASIEQSTSGHKSRNLHRYLLSSPRYWNTEEREKRLQRQQERYEDDLMSHREEHERYDQMRATLLTLKMTEAESGEEVYVEERRRDDLCHGEGDRGVEAEGSFFTTQETLPHLESLSFLPSARASRLQEESEISELTSCSSLVTSSLSSSQSFLRVPCRPERHAERSHKSPRKKYS